MTTEMMQVLELVDEMAREEKKSYWRDVFYRRGGKLVKRSYGELVRTERFKELFHDRHSGIRGVKVFKCRSCGEMVDYFQLESWCCDFDEPDGCLCSLCYEKEMGDDL